MKASRIPIDRIGLAVLGLVAVLLSSAGRAPDEPRKEKRGKPASYIGVVKDAAEDEKSFSLRSKRVIYEVMWDENTRWVEHTKVTLHALKEGERIHILGQAIPARPGGAGISHPPRLIKIKAIVAGSAFEPPPVSPKLRRERIRWSSDGFSWNGIEFLLGEYVISTEHPREVLRVKEVAAGPPKKSTNLFVGGYLDDSDRKNKKLLTTEVIRIAPEYLYYKLTHDLENRRPKPKRKNDNPFGS